MMFDLKDAELKKTRFYQEVYAEGHGEGHEEGRRSEAALVLRQLPRRLGPLTVAIEGCIAALSCAQLETLGEALFDFVQASDRADWLKRYG